MKIQIYAEDTHCEAFAVLAEKAIRQAVPDASPIVSAVRRGAREMQREMSALVRGAHQDGFSRVIFVLDRESEWSRERPALIVDICRAFDRLCRELPSAQELAGVKVVLVIANRCLESWLLTDVDGLIEYARGKRGLHRFTGSSFRSGRTDEIDRPVRRIDALFAQVAIDIQSGPKRCEKSKLKQMAHFVDPQRGQNNNRSFAYFLEMVTSDRDGCGHPYQREQCSQTG